MSLNSKQLTLLIGVAIVMILGILAVLWFFDEYAYCTEKGCNPIYYGANHPIWRPMERPIERPIDIEISVETRSTIIVLEPEIEMLDFLTHPIFLYAALVVIVTILSVCACVILQRLFFCAFPVQEGEMNRIMGHYQQVSVAVPTCAPVPKPTPNRLIHPRVIIQIHPPESDEEIEMQETPILNSGKSKETLILNASPSQEAAILKNKSSKKAADLKQETWQKTTLIRSGSMIFEERCSTV
ncbi:Protein CBG27688 [Caenorhabditis briggsae]|uniref:Protein CBG27688 n=2 Tax=Caenorhabditis briggsae TaxID=6238 RepID=B6IJD3_CAEBR|nr:Protein CBG27688 [Caenorhabditis briggsae]CAR99967.1 Protein CBG27688 [Caenorhabditis briggsae]